MGLMESVLAGWRSLRRLTARAKHFENERLCFAELAINPKTRAELCRHLTKWTGAGWRPEIDWMRELSIVRPDWGSPA